jgi:hypothetical protein
MNADSDLKIKGLETVRRSPQSPQRLTRFGTELNFITICVPLCLSAVELPVFRVNIPSCWKCDSADETINPLKAFSKARLGRLIDWSFFEGEVLEFLGWTRFK